MTNTSGKVGFISKLICFIVLALYVSIIFFPMAMLGHFDLAIPEINFFDSTLYLYIICIGIFLAFGKKTGWFMLFLSVIYKLIQALLTLILGLFTLPKSEESGLLIFYYFIPVFIYFVMGMALYLKRIKNEFNVFEESPSLDSSQKDVKILHILNLVLVFSIFSNSLVILGILFLIIDALPHLTAFFIIRAGLKKNFTFSWYVLMLVTLERIYMSLGIIITATERALYFYSFVLQLIICLITLYFILQKRVLSYYRIKTHLT